MGVLLDGSRVVGRMIVRLRRRTVALSVILGVTLAALICSPVSPANADTVTDDFRVGYMPNSIAVNPVTNTVYITTGEGVYVHGGPAGGRHIPVFYTTDVAVNTATNKIYVSTNYDYVAVVDGATYGEPERIPAKGSILAVNEKNNKIYLGSTNALTIIDGATQATTILPITGGVEDIVVNYITNKVYVMGGGTITVIDAGTGRFLDQYRRRWDLGRRGQPGINKIYFTTSSKYGAGIQVIDGKTDTITSSIPSAYPVGKLAINTTTNRIYAELERNSSNRFVQVIDAGNHKAGN